MGFERITVDPAQDGRDARDDDVTVLHHAQTDDRVLVTADTDFGGLLAGSGQRLPSVVLLRRIQGRKAAVQAQRLLDHLEDVRDDLEAGSIVTFEDARLRPATTALKPSHPHGCCPGSRRNPIAVR